VAGAGPLPSDIQPVANETRDRIITGLVTLVPFVAIVFAGWQVWGSALHWSDVLLFVGIYLLTGLLWGGLVRVFVLHHFTPRAPGRQGSLLRPRVIR
jgi:stearoyl-CoA desaturase (Delta-9 desaturase)